MTFLVLGIEDIDWVVVWIGVLGLFACIFLTIAVWAGLRFLIHQRWD